MAGPPPLPPNGGREKRASEIMAVNLSIPGLGTLQAGRKFTGWSQLVVAVIGLLLTSYFAGWFLLEWKSKGVFPMTTMSQTGQLPESWKIPFLVGLGGVGVFVVALGWSLASSLAYRRAQEWR